ncbi:hypothetical protein [Magnetospirillum molischianum]|uniref:Uncharacterized protein n=1 Tax=Magnetospirillum molischianum DSM 120 TaxID=1150626 RepID=H8FWH0_MAGML|nr:hypothetical protein [Magnetospirillum molischianum]CCG42708.1 hypothetical protein PHAMO_400089 [Magnetospirillum molischianum DSM 120]
MANQLVAAGDRRVSIVATALKTDPSPGDTLTADGQTWTVIAVSSDPAKAVWVVAGSLMDAAPAQHGLGRRYRQTANT